MKNNPLLLFDIIELLKSKGFNQRQLNDIYYYIKEMPGKKELRLTKRSYWKNKKLIAIDECVMNSDFRKTLTIGKEYEIEFVGNVSFSVIDDYGESHYFDFKEYKDFFKVKTEK